MTKDEMLKYCFSCMAHLEHPDDICPVCGYDNHNRLNAAHQLPYSHIGGQYIIGRALGQGGFGITYIGRELSLDRKVAIKEYYPTNIASRTSQTATQQVCSLSDDSASFAKGREQFMREAKMLAQLSSINNIVHVIAHFTANNTGYIVMDFVDGVTLEKRMRERGGQLSLTEALAIARPLIIALGKLHAHGVVHRDISPDNIILRGEDDEPVLIDFGAARFFALDGDSQHRFTTFLKNGYAPEEQYRENADQNAATDVYALCATLYYAITGKVPAQSLQRRFGDVELAPPSALGVAIPPQVEDALMRGMAIRNADRYQSMAELAKAMFGGTLGLPMAKDAAEAEAQDVAYGHTVVYDEQATQPVPSAKPIAEPSTPAVQEQPKAQAPARKKRRFWASAPMLVLYALAFLALATYITSSKYYCLLIIIPVETITPFVIYLVRHRKSRKAQGLPLLKGFVVGFTVTALIALALMILYLDVAAYWASSTIYNPFCLVPYVLSIVYCLFFLYRKSENCCGTKDYPNIDVFKIIAQLATGALYAGAISVVHL